MRSLRTASCCTFALLLSCAIHAEVPTVEGQVTDAVSTTDFFVDGHHILCDAKTQFSTLRPADAAHVVWNHRPYLGEPLQIYGHEDKKAHSIHATRVVFAATDPLLHGRGVIEELPAPPSSGTRIIRADGYRILIDSATQLSFAEPLQSLDDLHTSQWVEYQGHMREDGILIAQKAHVEPNILAPREQRLQQKYNYDPSQAAPARPSEDVTGYFGHLLPGHDPMHIPPANDPAQQGRLEQIGQRLIPHFVRDLPSTDPGKIDFRFQLIDDRKIHKGIALPNGIILMPREIATRLDNDDQYATYIASCMAAVIEKQQLRFQTELRLLNGPTVTALAITQPLLVPLMSKREDLLEYESEESIRVALGLVHDAGFNLAEAPKAWWLLAGSGKQPLTNTPIPFEAAYAYAMLGALWRNEIEHTAANAP